MICDSWWCVPQQCFIFLSWKNTNFFGSKKQADVFTAVAFHAVLTVDPGLVLNTAVKFNNVLLNDGNGWVDQWWRWVTWPVMEMGELTNDGWVDQWWRWVSWPIMEMGELTNDGDGWVDQRWRWVRWGIMEMGELTNDGYGWVDQWWRWVTWPMMEMGELTKDGDGWVNQRWRWVSWPKMEMGELTNDGDGWVDQWWRWVSWPKMEMGELTSDGDGELTNDGDGWVDQRWRWVSWPVMEMGELTCVDDGGGWTRVMLILPAVYQSQQCPNLWCASAWLGWELFKYLPLVFTLKQQISLLFSVGTIATLESSEFPWVGTEPTTSPPLSWWGQEKWPSLKSRQMVRCCVEGWVTKTTMEWMISPKLSAAVWRSYKKVS